MNEQLQESPEPNFTNINEAPMTPENVALSFEEQVALVKELQEVEFGFSLLSKDGSAYEFLRRSDYEDEPEKLARFDELMARRDAAADKLRESVENKYAFFEKLNAVDEALGSYYRSWTSLPRTH